MSIKNVDKQLSVLLNVILFLLFPIYSLLLSIRNIGYNRVSLYMIGMFFSLFGAFLPPATDAYRYRQDYYEATSFSFNFLSDKGKDCLYPLLSYIFNSMGFSFESYRFVLLLFCYIIYIWLFFDVVSCKKSISNKMYVLLAFSFILSIRIFTLSYGIRFGVASIWIVFSLYLLSTRRCFGGVLFAILSVLMHFSMLIMVVLIGAALVLQLVKVSIRYKIVTIFLFAISLSLSLRLYIDFFSVLIGSDFVSTYSNAYVEGSWGTTSMLDSLSLNGLIFTIGRIVPIFPICIYCCSLKTNSFLANLFVSILFLMALSSSSLTLVLRFSNVGIMIGFILLLINLESIKNQTRKFRVIVFSFVTVFLFYSYAMRDDLKYGKQYYALFCPLYSFTTNLYPDEWVIQNIKSDGLFVNTTMQH